MSQKYVRFRWAIRPGIAAMWLVLIGAVLCAPARADAASPGTEPVLSCADLAGPDLVTAAGKTVRFDKIPDALTRILKTSEVGAKGEVPAYCSASGYIANSIGIEIHMPLHEWNGKFALVGCGGMCGFIQQEACDTAVTRGYSCIFSDMGHHSTQVDCRVGLQQSAGAGRFRLSFHPSCSHRRQGADGNFLRTATGTILLHGLFDWRPPRLYGGATLSQRFQWYHRRSAADERDG